MNPAALPAKEALLQACRVEPRENHPLLRGIHLLAGLHERHLRGDVDATRFHAGRETIVLAIDHWVAAEIPAPRGGAHMHTETLGSVLDRLARQCAGAHAAMTTSPDRRVHEEWEHLAQLALGYADLAIELTAGSRRLPTPPGVKAEHLASQELEHLISCPHRPVPISGIGRSASIITLSA